MFTPSILRHKWPYCKLKLSLNQNNFRIENILKVWRGQIRDLLSHVTSCFSFSSHFGDLSNVFKKVLECCEVPKLETAETTLFKGETLLSEASSGGAMQSSLSQLVSSLVSSFLNFVFTFISRARLFSGLSRISVLSLTLSSDTLVMLLANLSNTAFSLFLLLSFPEKRFNIQGSSKTFLFITKFQQLIRS